MLRTDGVSYFGSVARQAVRPTAAGLLGAVVCAAVVACGSSAPSKRIDSVAIERSIARSILAEHHLRTKVACPAKVDEHQGGTFNCYALLQVGRYRVPVTQTDDHGDVKWHTRQPITLLNTTRIEHAIASSIEKQRKVSAKVTCPSQVLQATGVRFTCVAATHGSSAVPAGRYSFKVTETNDAGHVSYIGT